jgi:hypothetical protein
VSKTRTARTDRFGKSTYQKAQPLPAGKRLGRKHVPDIPPGKFKDLPGQGVMDFGSDDPNAVIWPDEA